MNVRDLFVREWNKEIYNNITVGLCTKSKHPYFFIYSLIFFIFFYKLCDTDYFVQGFPIRNEVYKGEGCNGQIFFLLRIGTLVRTV